MRIELGSVWAPRATSVDLVVDDAIVPLVRSADAVWSPSARDAARLMAGSRYGFRLDGGDEVLTDPRSRCQPDGPLGRSMVDDPDRFEWSDGDFVAEPWPRAVLYELHVGTFSAPGTFRGAIERLDHLAELGITHVELMPVGAWVGRFGWGYDGVCWWAPHPAYGGPDDLRALVDACHRRGLAVVLDVVFNHLGPEGAQLDRFGPYTRQADTPWGRAVNLDGEQSGPVRDHIVDCSMMWLESYHLDGLRLDAVHALEDRSPRHLVAELTAQVEELSDALGRELVVIAEWDRHDPIPVVDRRDRGWGCRAQWADDLHHALHVALTGESHGYYADAAAADDPVLEALRCVYVPRRATGDPASEHTVDGMSRTCFVVCQQNHDQVGNRAAGERLAHLAPLDAVMAALPLVLLGPSVPLLFQGEEWAATSPFPFFADHAGELADAVRRGRLAEFSDLDPDLVADPGDPATFAGAVLNWNELSGASHRDVLGWYRSLIALRRERPELAAGSPGIVGRPSGSADVVVMERGSTLVACNLGKDHWLGDGIAEGATVQFVAGWGEVTSDARSLGGHSAGVFVVERRGR